MPHALYVRTPTADQDGAAQLHSLRLAAAAWVDGTEGVHRPGHSGAKASRPALGELAPRMRRSSCKFPALGRSLTALTLALAGACNRCDAPAQTKYSCNSIDPTADGCVGEPALGADAGANPTTYPLGCMAELPYCSPYYPDRHGQPCKCDDLHVLDAGPQWVCPM